MNRISSNSTLFWKIFLPTFWFSFYGIFTIALWAYQDEGYGILFTVTFRISATLFYVIGSFVLYFTFLQLKRIEYEEGYLYVTNYFRTIKVSFTLIQHIDIRNYFILKRGKVYLHEETPFGKSFTFITSKVGLNQMAEEFPEFFIKPDTETPHW